MVSSITDDRGVRVLTKQRETDDFVSSGVFDIMVEEMKNDEKRKDTIDKTKAVVVMKVRNKDGRVESWWIDLKHEGKVGRGQSPYKPDLVVAVGDQNLKNMVEGRATAQKYYMMGRLKVRGSIIQALKIEKVLRDSQPDGKAML